MTIKEFRESTPLKEQEVFAKKLQVWLGDYVDKIINKVMLEKMEDILNNEFALKLIDELYERTLKEQKDQLSNLMFGLGNGIEFSYHSNCLTHSKSYRDVLYDMYIAGWNEE